MTRVAAVDLGSNATRLLVAEVTGGEVRELVRRTRITRLGEGVDARRRLLPLPIARVRNVLTDYRREAESLGAERVLAVGTSAVRDAENGEAFLGEVEWSYGFATRLLSGDEEAELMLRGVGRLEEGTVVTDIGGGSTELAADSFRASLDIGCVRLTERYRTNLDEAARAVRERLPEMPFRAHRALGVDGTTAELAAMTGGRVIAADAVDRALTRLAALPDEGRRALLVEPDRSGVVVMGVLVLRELLRHLGVDRIEASERDLLDGAALEAASLPPVPEGEAPPGAFACC